MADGTSEHSSGFTVAHFDSSIHNTDFTVAHFVTKEHSTEFVIKSAVHHYTDFEIVEASLPSAEGRIGRIVLPQNVLVVIAPAASARKHFYIHLDIAKDVFISTDSDMDAINCDEMGFKLKESAYSPPIESTKTWYAIAIEADTYIYIYQNFRGG